MFSPVTVPFAALLFISAIKTTATSSSSIFEESRTTTTLFAGDSDIELWPTDSEYPNSTNKGVGGSTCRATSRKISQHLNRHEPEWVVLVCGENDLWSQSASETFTDFTAVVDTIVDAGARVVYMGTKPEPDTQPLHSKYRKYDAKIRTRAVEMDASAAAAARPPPLVMVDVYPVFEAIEESDPGLLYRNDGLHLSAAGYAYWDDWLGAVLADAAGFCVRWEGGSCREESVGGASVSPVGAPFATPSPTAVDDGLPQAVLGGAGVNLCPEGYRKIQSRQGCQAAMALVGQSDWEGSEDEGDWPSKCYFCEDVQDCTDGVWFNRHSTGEARGGARPICALPGWEEQNICGDDSDWRFTKNNGSRADCRWVGNKKKNARCRKTGDDGRKAYQACRFACLGKGSTCAAGCLDDDDWKFQNSKGQMKKCKWVGKSPKKRCLKVGQDGRVASEACALSCSGNGSEC